MRIMLQQWKEPCQPGVINIDCAIVSSNPNEIETATIMPSKTEDYTGNFKLWLVGPLLHFIAASITIFYTDSTDFWWYSSIWSLAIGYAVILWFHEFLIGGPYEKDNLYSNFNRINCLSFVILLGLTGYAGY